MKIFLILLTGILLLSNISGCATIKGEMTVFWEKIKGKLTEKRQGTREEAVRKYNYQGFKDELIMESPIITPSIVSSGDEIKQEIQYTLLSPKEENQFKVSENVTLSGTEISIELSKKESKKDQGTHVSVLQFVVPKDLDPGHYELVTGFCQ
ncbi:MAG: hypothetical protein AB1632_14505 [Nitrospirota bacterium]